MKNLVIIFTAIIFISVIELNAQNVSIDGIQFEQGTWTEILAKAKAENKLIFLDAYASWCGPCKHMAKNVFTDEEVAKNYNLKFINAKIDMEKGEGIELAKQYDVTRYPTFLFINGNGEVVHQACGAKERQDFIALGRTALEPNQTTSYYRSNYKKGDVDGKFMMEYIDLLDNACISTNEELQNYFAKLPASEHLEGYNSILVYKYVKYSDNPGFQTLINNPGAFTLTDDVIGEKMDENALMEKINSVYSYSLKYAAKEKDKTKFEEIKNEIQSVDVINPQKLLLKGDMHWYKYQKDWPKFVQASSEFVETYAMEDYKVLNSIAWTFYENVDDKQALELALEWALMSTSINPEYGNMDTLAALYYKLGMKNEAGDAAQRAIDLGEKHNIDTDETQALLDKIMQLN